MPVLNATGVWTEINLGQSCLFAAGNKGEIHISKKDRERLRNLAFKVESFSESSLNKEKINLWYEHNDLVNKKPLILCDPENGWNEVIFKEMLECKGTLARRWEVILLKEIFYGEKMHDDKTIEKYFDISFTFCTNNWIENEILYGGKNGGSYIWEGQIKKISDLSKIKFPKIEVDYETTLDTFILANEVFENILIPRITGFWWLTLGMSYDLVRLTGLENMMFLIYDDPSLIHSIMEILLNGNMQKLNFLEENNLLTLNNNNLYVGSGGLGYSRQLPKNDVTIKKVKTNDLWGFAESQETVGISPSMFEEFFYPYQLQILSRFGLNCYGCCEALDKRWHIIKNIPNLRRISISPWANLEKMSQFIEDKFIFSYKPRPTDIAEYIIDEERIRKNIAKVLRITKGCIIEIIMKDNHTIGKNPENLSNWVRIVREEIEKVY